MARHTVDEILIRLTCAIEEVRKDQFQDSLRRDEDHREIREAIADLPREVASVVERILTSEAIEHLRLVTTEKKKSGASSVEIAVDLTKPISLGKHGAFIPWIAGAWRALSWAKWPLVAAIGFLLRHLLAVLHVHGL